MSSSSISPADGLARALRRVGLPGPVGLERLSGGANMESSRFSAGAEVLVLRRAPSAAMMADRPLDHAGEASLIRAAKAHGVIAPEVVVELAPEDGIGSGFVMRALPGTADPHSILVDGNPARLLRDIAHSLAAIHRIPIDRVRAAPVLDTAVALAGLRERFIEHGADRPVLALTLRWLEANLPGPVPLRLVHGDYRLGNLLVEDGRLTGVLDWELAHRGDFHEDLAFGCMTVWRFTRPDRPAFGLGSLDDWFAAYEAAGGEQVDAARFRFWLVYRTLWWALGCLDMGKYWREGMDRSLERVVIARRTSEQELDLLVLLEEDAPEAERGAKVPRSDLRDMTPVSGEPAVSEILTAVSEWLAADIKPLVEGRNKFDLAVARNALGIVTRELAQRPLATDATLAGELLSGMAGLATPGLLARLRRMTLDKVTADMPKYPGLAIARARWEGT